MPHWNSLLLCLLPIVESGRSFGWSYRWKRAICYLMKINLHLIKTESASFILQLWVHNWKQKVKPQFGLGACALGVSAAWICSLFAGGLCQRGDVKAAWGLLEVLADDDDDSLAVASWNIFLCVTVSLEQHFIISTVAKCLELIQKQEKKNVPPALRSD